MITSKSQAMIPKTANYWSNGCGRDSYIYTSNGGFAKRPCTSKIMSKLYLFLHYKY